MANEIIIIRQLYSSAMQAQFGQDPPQEYVYWTTNSKKFWAEASVSFLVAEAGSSYPEREWIEQNDSLIFSLLSEVWCGAQYASFENLQTFCEELEQRGVYQST